MSESLTHLDDQGQARMVDVGAKAATQREAEAQAIVEMQPVTLERIMAHNLPKGDVLSTARIAGIMAAKRTSELIPLCHPLPLSSVQVAIQPAGPGRLLVLATVRCTGQTGVEMEALAAATVAALTIYDMAKAIDQAMIVTDVRLRRKTGGKRGDFIHPIDAIPPSEQPQQDQQPFTTAE
ncbi:MAG TPA: cyclic pyranopterin monophosphate synthase MoaC [Herpetosiphonaceae bacterium]